jgi:hypothetical protein
MEGGLLRVNVVQNTIEQQRQVIRGGLQIIVEGKLLKDCERRRGNAVLRTQAGTIFLSFKSLSWLVRNTAGDRYETFLGEHRALCD